MYTIQYTGNAVHVLSETDQLTNEHDIPDLTLLPLQFPHINLRPGLLPNFHPPPLNHSLTPSIRYMRLTGNALHLLC